MSAAEDVILNVLSGVKGPVPATKLVKLIYLVDYVHFQHYGSTVTGFQYQWDHYGPNAVGHAIVGEAERLALTEQVNYTQRQNSYGGITKYFELTADCDVPTLSPEPEMAINDVIHQHGRLSVKDITAESKKTEPFRNASPYDMLKMDHSIPAVTTTEEDWRAYQADIEENGTLSLEQIKERYGLE